MFLLKGFIRLLIIMCLCTFSVLADEQVHYYSSQDINDLPSKAPDHIFNYGSDPKQFAELRLPSGKGLFPVIIILHGGCWISSVATSHHTAAIADALRDQGYATWNVEYRGIDDTGGGWLGTFQDTAEATDYLKKIAVQYHLDLHHVIAIGHSAGGHLALWLAARHKLPTSSVLYSKHPLTISGVVTVGGIPDLRTYNAQQNNPCGNDTISHLLGDDAATLSQRYQETSPAELLPLGVKQILIYGTDDTIVPASYGQDYGETANQDGDDVKLVVIKNAGHFEYVAPNSITWPAITEAIQTLLK
jgi:acetyl esterase/lipase